MIDQEPLVQWKGVYFRMSFFTQAVTRGSRWVSGTRLPDIGRSSGLCAKTNRSLIIIPAEVRPYPPGYHQRMHYSTWTCHSY